MRLFRSMRWRLQFWHGLLLAAVLAGFAFTAYEYERRQALSSTDSELERRAASMSRLIRGGPPPRRERDGAPDDEGPGPGERRLPENEEMSYMADAPGGWYYVVWVRGPQQPTASPNAPLGVPRPLREDIVERGPNFRVRGLFREAFIPVGPGVVALVGRDMTGEAERLARFATLLAGSAAAILALGLLGGRWLVGRSLRPIADIGAAARRIAQGDLTQRIGTADTDSEFGELAEILNTTFARLEASFAHQARFTADAAHELRTPVAVLLTHTQNALAAPCSNEGHREAFEACQRAAQRMRSLIDSLMRLARIDAGQAESRNAPLDLARRASEAVEMLGPLAASRGITVRSELEPAPAAGDPGEIDQVIVNLLSNAIQHNTEGGDVLVRSRTEAGLAVLTVADRGPGIAPEHLPHVFERFYRADASRSRSSGGVGLGLSIALAIVKAHGGTLLVESRPGEGALFTLRLPAR